MGDIIHLPKISIVKSGVKVDINLQKYGKRMETAQWLLGETVLASCKPYMPLSTGNLQQRSGTEEKHMTDRSEVDKDGRRVVFPGPAARMLYMGKKMVDSKTGRGPRKIPTGPNEYVLRFRKGAKLKATEESLNLKHGNPDAKPRWFEYAKNLHLKDWVHIVKKTLMGEK